MARVNRWLDRLGRGLFGLLSVAALAGCAGYVRERIYLPDPAAEAYPAWPGRAPERISVMTEDGLTLAGDWWAPADPRAGVIVYFPGNAGNLELNARRAAPLAAGGRGLMVAAWRGYPPNDGRPSEAGLMRDASAFVAEARRRAPEAPIIPFGYSTGGAMAIAEGAKGEVAGVITLGAFTRLADVAPGYARPFLPDRYDNLAAIARLKVPVFLIHGTADEVVPYAHAARLAEAAGGPAQVVTLRGGDHHPPLEALLPTVDRAVDQMLSAGSPTP